jgi:hypothetical protein
MTAQLRLVTPRNEGQFRFGRPIPSCGRGNTSRLRRAFHFASAELVAQALGTHGRRHAVIFFSSLWSGIARPRSGGHDDGPRCRLAHRPHH